MYPLKYCRALWILKISPKSRVSSFSILCPTTRYEQTGQNCTLEDVAKEISTRLGKQVVCKPVSSEEVLPKSTLQHVELLSDLVTEGMDRMLYYYNRSLNILRWVLGRGPTTWAALLCRDIQG
ncbi:hypothetical protein SCP_1403890 [Sparassis crispa]|uniref:Uncharacterized protein n=1 Tax=Sparassis crispa TaxID=139825 RepID=A0A401H3J9_9APHY|nr:hypothetical protein SCP_1403890 [Sparassis crispa]GBE88981.1 hypothetical protein SCP_1403890 [Sparassis crispa]